MTLDEAVKVALHVRKAREIAGMYCDVAYTQIQLVNALIALVDATGERPVSREEHTLVVRQGTAMAARLAKYEGKNADRHKPSA